jgi:hypothetical protein
METTGVDAAIARPRSASTNRLRGQDRHRGLAAAQPMLAERPPGSCDGVGESRGGQQRTAKLLGQVLHPDHFIDRGADHRELQTLGHADGPLFCEAGKDGTTNGSAEGVYSRIHEMVRGVVPDPRVQPNHAWRYTFKSFGLEAGLNEFSLHVLCGHATKSKGGLHEGHSKKRIEVMAAFPRYEISETARRSAITVSSPQPVV